MAKRQRRQSQNSQYMRQILNRLREFDLEEVRMLCEKHQARQSEGAGSPRGKGRGGRRKAVR